MTCDCFFLSRTHSSGTFPRSSEDSSVDVSASLVHSGFLYVGCKSNWVGSESQKNIEDRLTKVWSCVQAVVEGCLVMASSRGIVHHPQLGGGLVTSHHSMVWQVVDPVVALSGTASTTPFSIWSLMTRSYSCSR